MVSPVFAERLLQVGEARWYTGSTLSNEPNLDNLAMMSQVADGYDAVAEAWDAMFVDNRAHAENRVTFGLLRRLGAFRGLVLDLACGTGLTLECAPDLRPSNYVGVDISSGMLRQARRRNPHYDFRQDDMTTVELPGVDAVIVPFCGFSYCPDATAMVRRAWTNLRPGGLLFLMPYAQREAVERHYARKDAAGLDVPRRIWSSAALRSLLQTNGFTEVETQGLSGPAIHAIRPSMPQAVVDGLLYAESATYGRVNPDDFLFLMGWGRKA